MEKQLRELFGEYMAEYTESKDGKQVRFYVDADTLVFGELKWLVDVFEPLSVTHSDDVGFYIVGTLEN